MQSVGNLYLLTSTLRSMQLNRSTGEEIAQALPCEANPCAEVTDHEADEEVDPAPPPSIREAQQALEMVIERSLTGSKYALNSGENSVSSLAAFNSRGDSEFYSGNEAVIDELPDARDNSHYRSSDNHYPNYCDPSRRVACGLCGDVFTDMEILIRHCDHVHGGEASPPVRRHGRPVELTAASSPDEGSNHYSPGEPFECHICGTTMHHKASFTAHMKTHGAAAADSSLSCPICGKRCSHQGSLTMHMRHSHRNISDLDCEPGDMPESVALVPPSDSAAEFKVKKEAIHAQFDDDIALGSVSAPGDAASTCKICGKFCGHKGGLTMHMRHTHGSERSDVGTERPLQAQFEDDVDVPQSSRYSMEFREAEKHIACYICGKVCAHKGALSMHVKLKHFVKEEQAPVNKEQDDIVDALDQQGDCSCPVCGKYCGHKGGLTMHLRYMHGLVTSPTGEDTLIPVALSEQDDGGARPTPPYAASEKNLECGICGKKVTHANNLKSHMKVHGYGDVDAQAKCTICDRQFMHKGNLTLHMRKHALKTEGRQREESARKDDVLNSAVVNGPSHDESLAEESAKLSGISWRSRKRLASPVESPSYRHSNGDRDTSTLVGRVNYEDGYNYPSSVARLTSQQLTVTPESSGSNFLMQVPIDGSSRRASVNACTAPTASSSHDARPSAETSSMPAHELDTDVSSDSLMMPSKRSTYSPRNKRQPRSDALYQSTRESRDDPSLLRGEDGLSSMAELGLSSVGSLIDPRSNVDPSDGSIRKSASNLASSHVASEEESHLADQPEHLLHAIPGQLNLKPFRCGICGKGFRLRGQLRIHDRVHSKEKPYTCEYCGKSFSQRSSMNTHVKSFHT